MTHDEPGLRSIVFDCEHAHRLATWWSEWLPGYRIREYRPEDIDRLRQHGIYRVEDDPSVVLDPIDGRGPTIWFNRVPEQKIVKNRVHVDVNVPSIEDIDRLVERGAKVVRPLGAVPDEKWAIMADPEGNEFCVFPLSG